MNAITGLLIVAGLAMAGSDGPCFPHINFIGLGCLCIVGFSVNRSVRTLQGAGIGTLPTR